MINKLESVSIEGDVFALGGGEEADFAEAEGVEDLRAKPVTTKVHTDGLEGAGLLRLRATLWDLEACAGVGHVEEGTLAFIGDLLKGSVDGRVLIGILGGKDVVEDILRLNSDEGRMFIEVTHGESEMDSLIGEGAEKMQGPLAVAVFEGSGDDTFDELLPIVPVFNELFNGDQFQVEVPAVFEEFGQPGHGTIFI